MSTILVVDDSYAELQMIQSYLKSAKYTVVSLPSADALEERLVNDRPDLIVLDVVMPGRNGFEACRDLKANESFKNIPIVLCTSKGAESDKFWGRQQGADGHVVKPFKSGDLIEVVKRVLDESALSAGIP